MATTTLRPNSTISQTECRDESGNTADLHTPINETISDTSDYTHTLHNSVDANCVLGLTDLPADAATNDPVTAVTYNITHRGFGTVDNDSITCTVQIQSSTGTAYTNAATIRTHNSGGTTSWATTGATGFTMQTAGLNASETDWNNAQVQFVWTYTKNGKADAIDIDIAWAEFVVTYDTAVTPPVISSPTASATGQNTGTGGFSTDTTSGTGYYYISTSATPPSAADLKAGTSPALDSGNSTVTASPHTFNFTGLPSGTTCYAHYIQNNGDDSNIVTSASFKTYAVLSDSESFDANFSQTNTNTLTGLASRSFDASFSQDNLGARTMSETITYLNNLTINQDVSLQLSEAINLVLQVAQQQDNNRTIPLSVNLEATLNFLLQSALTHNETITYAALLDSVFNNNKSTQESLLLEIQLSQNQVTPITGSVAFGMYSAMVADNTKVTAEQFSANVILDQAGQVSKLLTEAHSFSFTLSFDGNPFGVGILDDPFYGSPDNYIFVDLANILAGGSTVKAGSITFTNQLGQQQTVGLIGQAAHTLLLYLAQQQSAVKTTTAAETFSGQFDINLAAAQLLSFTATLNLSVIPEAQVNALKSMFFNLALSQQETLDTIRYGDLTLSALFDMVNANQATAIKSMVYTALLEQNHTVVGTKLGDLTLSAILELLPDSLVGQFESLVFSAVFDQNLVNVAQKPGELTVNSIFDLNTFNTLLVNKSVTFETTLDLLKSVSLQLSEAINFLLNLDLTVDAATTVSVPFNLLLNQIPQVQGTLLSTVALINNLTTTFDKQLTVDKAIAFLTQLDFQVASLEGIVAAIEYGLILDQTADKIMTADKAVSYLLNLTQEQNVSLTATESILLTVQMLDVYSNTKTVPLSTTFDAQFQQSQTNLLNKIVSATFTKALDLTVTNQVDFKTVVDFSAILATIFTGDAAGTASGAVTFGLNLTEDNVSLATYTRAINFQSILDLASIAGLTLTDSLNFTATFDNQFTNDLSIEGFVTLQSFYSKLADVQQELRPSLDFDLQLLDTSTANKNTLASMLLNMETSLINNASRTVPGLIQFAIQNDIETDIHLIAEGRVTMTAEMAQSPLVQLLGQRGITIGHILGLSSFSGAVRDADISFGTIHDFSVDGFTIQFTITTPEGRRIKVYFEDRILIVDEEDRAIKIYPDFRSDNTIN